MYFYFMDSPLGSIRLTSDGEAITGLHFVENDGETAAENIPVFECCVKELNEYFIGARKIFTVKTKNAGTEFMEKCWRQLLSIPYGTTRSYRDIAGWVGNPNAARAVGGANNKNNISIIYPCHRVVGKNGDLTGYGGGLWRKEWLLKHEAAHL